MNGIGLDYEILKCEDGFQVWTPDENGACIGSGRTEREAKEDAIRSMESLIEVLLGAKGKGGA